MLLLIKEVHPSLISSKYLAKALQHNNPSHSVVTSASGSRNMKQALQSRFLYRVAPNLWIGTYSTLRRLWDHHQVPSY